MNYYLVTETLLVLAGALGPDGPWELLPVEARRLGLVPLH